MTTINTKPPQPAGPRPLPVSQGAAVERATKVVLDAIVKINDIFEKVLNDKDQVYDWKVTSTGKLEKRTGFSRWFNEFMFNRGFKSYQKDQVVADWINELGISPSMYNRLEQNLIVLDSIIKDVLEGGDVNKLSKNQKEIIAQNALDYLKTPNLNDAELLIAGLNEWIKSGETREGNFPDWMDKFCKHYAHIEKERAFAQKLKNFVGSCTESDNEKIHQTLDLAKEEIKNLDHIQYPQVQDTTEGEFQSAYEITSSVGGGDLTKKALLKGFVSKQLLQDLHRPFSGVTNKSTKKNCPLHDCKIREGEALDAYNAELINGIVGFFKDSVGEGNDEWVSMLMTLLVSQSGFKVSNIDGRFGALFHQLSNVDDSFFELLVKRSRPILETGFQVHKDVLGKVIYVEMDFSIQRTFTTVNKTLNFQQKIYLISNGRGQFEITDRRPRV